MSFLAPALLGLLALAALPIAIHLLTRRRATRRPFPALALLARSEGGRARRSRLRERVVLALRAGALAAAALAAAGALWRGAWSAEASRPAVVVVDASASMAQSGPEGSAWSRARAIAGRLVESLAPRPRAVVIADAPASRSSPTPIAAPGPALALLADAEPGSGDGAVAEALAAAVAMVGGAGDIYLVTDLSRTSLAGIDPQALPAGVRLRLVDAGGGAANRAVVGLSTEPGVAVAGRPVTVNARVANYTAEPLEARLRLRVGAEAWLLEARVPAGGSTVVSRAVTIDSAGWVAVSAELDGTDALPLDDRRAGAVQVVDSLRAVVAGDGDRDDAAGALRPLAAALAAAGFAPRVVDGAALGSVRPACDLLVTAGLADGAAAREAVRAHLADGGAWLQVIASDGDATLAGALGHEPPMALGGRIDVSEQERGRMGIGQARLEHALLAPFAGREALLEAVGAYRYRLTPRGAAADAAPLLAYADGTIAMAERPVGAGRWLALNCSTAAVDSTLSRSEALPLLIGRLPAALLPARSADLARDAGARVAAAAGIAFIGAGGEEPDRALPLEQGHARLSLPGLYRAEGGALTAAAVPAAESDLRRIDPALTAMSALDADGAISASAPSPAWPWLLVAAALALALESTLVAGRRA